MVSVVALVAAVALSLLLTRVGAMALMLTGLSRELARFQARSAFTGVGFTTSEAEQVVNHPVRRRILMLLMLLGNAGVITVVATLVITFGQSGGAEDWLFRTAIIAGGFVALWFLSWNHVIDRGLSRFIAFGLKKWTSVDARDYAHLLHLAGEYGVAEMGVEQKDWIAGKTLAETRLRSEGLLVLGLHRPDGTYIGAPDGETSIGAGDTLILYGREHTLSNLDMRRDTWAGEKAHELLEQEHERVVQEERQRDPERSATNERSS